MSYGPPPWRPLVLLAAALGSAGAAIVIPPLWALTAVLLLAAARDWWNRTALHLGPDGFRYVDGLRKEFAPWNEVEAVRVRQERHFLAFGRMLEIDLTDETLIVLSRTQLGADPDEVAPEFESAWYRAVRSGWPSGSS